MGVLSPAECGKNIRSGNYDTLYFFYGRDVGALEPYAARLADKLCPKDSQMMNLHRFDAEDVDMEIFSDAVQVLPMFAERVIVTLSGLNMEKFPKAKADILRKIISDIPETTTVIISAGGEDRYKNRRSLTDKNKRFADNCAKHGTVCEFNFRTPNECARDTEAAIARRGCTISRQNASYLVQLCMCETAHINSEIEKLCAYANGKEILREDIDALVIKKVESDGYGLALNILKNNALFVFKRIDELRVQNYEPTQIIAIISMSLLDIYRAKLCKSRSKSYGECAEIFGYPKNREFAVRNAYGDCSNISLETIRKTFKLLSQTELRMKTVSMGESDAFLALEQFCAAAMA